MAKNKKVNRRNPKQEQQGSILPFISGLCVGLFVAFVVYLKGSQPSVSAGDPVSSSQHKEASIENNQAIEEASSEKPKFDFYTILPEREVKVPEWEPPKKKIKQEVEKSSDNFVFQVGSFQKHAEADSVKARLAMLGLPVSIKKVVVNGQNVWFRVRVGPYKDESKLSSVGQRLTSSNLDYILLRIKDNEL